MTESDTPSKPQTAKVGKVWEIDAKAGQRVQVIPPFGSGLTVHGKGGSARVVLDRPGPWSAQLLTDAGNPSGDAVTITAK